MPESIRESCRSVEEMTATCPPPASHLVSVLIPEERQKEKRGNHSQWNEDIQTSNIWNLRLSEHPEQTWVYGQTSFEVTFGFSCISKFTATSLKNKATTGVIDFNYWSINCSCHFLYKFGFSWRGKSREPYCQNSMSPDFAIKKKMSILFRFSTHGSAVTRHF